MAQDQISFIIMSSVAFVRNTFITIIVDDEAQVVSQRLSPSKTIDIGSLTAEAKATFGTDTDSTGCSESTPVAEAQVLMAAAHACGECKPCSFAMKANGCRNDECGFCHEEHDKEFLKFIKKRNRAMRMANIHGNAPRCAENYQQYSQQRGQCC